MMRRTLFRSRLSTVSDTLGGAGRTAAGQQEKAAGTVALQCDITAFADIDEETRRPPYRPEAIPKSPGHNTFNSFYKWGHDSLTLFKKMNEDPGPWWNANNSGTISLFTQLGGYAACGLWSGVGHHAMYCGEYNPTPQTMLARAFGRKDKNGAIAFSGRETIKSSTQRLMMPHTKEHEQHKRFRNPELPGFKQIEAVQGKRVLREVQYHLGNGIRHYMVDGAFGSHPGSCTPYRIILDNATHGYYATLMAIRNKEHFSVKEVALKAKKDENPLDEFAWRRPGVVVYHAAGYDFEMPRIVEEFGGPRPQDIGLSTPRFTVLEPYSIPMKGIVGGETRCQELLETVAFLCARWGFYADDKNLLTLPGDSILSQNGQLTLVVNNASDAAGLRQSPFLFGAHHHRITAAGVARGWDGNTRPAAKTTTTYGDLVETDESVVHSPLRAYLGNDATLSHRFTSRRRLGDFGYKRKHDYSTSTGTPRPNLVTLSNVQIVIVTPEDIEGGVGKLTGDSAGQALASTMAKHWMMYAKPEEIASAFNLSCGSVPVYAVNAKDVKSVLGDLAKSGMFKPTSAKEVPKTSAVLT